MAIDVALTDRKLVTCVVPKGLGMDTLKAVRKHFGVEASNIHNARGVGRHTPLRARGIGDQAEKEVFSFIVSADRADEAFEYVYHEAHVDQPHGGIIYMSAITAATPFMLPDLPEED
jgi:nitrogen regulatory protein PII